MFYDYKVGLQDVFYTYKTQVLELDLTFHTVSTSQRAIRRRMEEVGNGTVAMLLITAPSARARSIIFLHLIHSSALFSFDYYSRRVFQKR